MRKIGILCAVLLGLNSAIPRESHASARKHRPWMMFRSTPKPTTIHQAQENVPNKTRSTAVGNKIVSQALRYKGARYKFGGTSKHGLDCSGLIARVWDDLKMKKVPRVSSALYHSGQPVSLAELRPGDLVFFKNTYKSGISHVGVYTGNNKFVHAANHRKGVTITRLSDPYYQLHYAGARRLY